MLSSTTARRITFRSRKEEEMKWFTRKRDCICMGTDSLAGNDAQAQNLFLMRMNKVS